MNSRFESPRRVRILGGECGAVARALHHAAQKVALVRNEQTLISDECVLMCQADLGKGPGSTSFERKQMSIKTSFLKRISATTVAALGLGLFVSISPSGAATFASQSDLVGTSVISGISLGAGSGQTMAVARVNEAYSFGARLSTGSDGAVEKGTQINLKFSQVPAGDLVNSAASAGSAISPTLSAVTLPDSSIFATGAANNTPIAQATATVPAFVTVGSAAAIVGSKTNVTVALAAFTPRATGTYKVFAWADTASAGNAIGTYDNGERTSTLTVVVGGAPATIAITAAATTAAANASGVFDAGSTGSGGDEGALFIISLTDADGNPTRPTLGESINLSTTLGTLADNSLTAADFNASGKAAVNLTHTATGTAVVTATSGGAMPTLTSKSASVSFTLADTAATDDASTFTDLTGLSSAAAFTGILASGAARTFAEGKASATVRVLGATAATVVAVQIYDFSGSITGYAGAAYSVPLTIGTGSTATYAVPLSALVEDDVVYVTVNASSDDTAVLTAAAVAVDSTNSSLDPATSQVVTGGGITLTAYAKDQFGQKIAGAAISWSVAGRNATTIPTVALMDSNGAHTYTLTDTSTSTTVLTSTISAAITYDGTTITETSSITFGAGNAVSTITVTTSPTLTVATTESAISTGATGAAAGAVTLAFTVKDAAGTVLVGVPVTFTSSLAETGFGSSATDTVDRKLAYTDATGKATTYVYGWKSPSTTTVTATAGGVTKTTTINFINAATDARTIAVTAEGTLAKATVKDRYGNPVKGVTVDWSRVGTGYFGNGVSATSGTTDADGVAEVVFIGSGTVKGSLAVATYTQVDDLASYVGATATSGVGATLAPAGIASATVSMATVDSAVTAAEAATDAAAEAIDAANAATDAANLAAEAADAATVAAEEARDAADAATAAVEELATQVATLMAALKAQITTLANTVAKIAKKVKA